MTPRLVLRAFVPALLLLGCNDSSGPDIGPPAKLVVLAGATQTGVFGQAAPVLPSVRVTDDRDRPVPGVAVTFTLASGGGSIGTPNSMTDATGVANPGSWTLGKNFGAKTLTATVGTLPPVTFTATVIAPDAGILAFNLTDPAADTLAHDTVGVPKAHDVLSLRGDFKRDSLILTLTFGGPIGSFTDGGDLAVVGFLELDIDDNPSSGVGSISDFFGGSGNLGIDYTIGLGGTATSVTVGPPSGPAVQVPAAFSGNTVIMRIPLAAIGNDDGNFSLVGIIGTVDRPTDVFPNSGATLVRPAATGANSRTRAPMPAAPSFKPVRSAWGKTLRIP
ncbi:MAG: hypothetical protein WEE89_20545 [Gemmatimonadota bacterium]